MVPLFFPLKLKLPKVIVMLEKKMEIDLSFMLSQIDKMDLDDKVNAINSIREKLHEISPFKSEPVDYVKWVKNTTVKANDYNPNSVATPEMELLRHSINMDGYTQPIVGWEQDYGHEVIDGFHRHRVGKEMPDIQERIKGYLPIVSIKSDRTDRNDRVASTIRHNRARGKHSVEAMSDIVMDLHKRNWSDKKIGVELGMDQDEVLRLTQLKGLMEAFSNKDFNEAWEVDDNED